MTLIVLLILAGVSLSGLFSEKGLFKRTENAGNRYNEAKAREVLETVLLADGQYEKNTNPKYNQDEFLDALIRSEIPGSDIKGDVAIIGEYVYELDRSVPKIGRYLGKASDLVFPTITSSTPILADDYRSSTFTVTAVEDKNGINKIEIWFEGEKIETLTKTYDNIKTEIKENYTVNRNGTYTIKAYGEFWASTTVEVTGIVPAVEFSPNGSTEWKKEHTTKVIVKETGEKVTSLKYKWTTSKTNEPTIEEFIENCPNNNIVTGGDNTMTGTYYLWVMVKTNTGKINICGSEGFKFDNQNPEITEFLYNPKTATTYNLNCNADDYEGSGIERYEIYMDNKCIDQRNSNEKTYISVDFNEVKDKKTIYKVIVYDKCGNNSQSEVTNMGEINIWKKYELIDNSTIELVSVTEGGYMGNLSVAYKETTYWSLTPEYVLNDSGFIVFKYPGAPGGWLDYVKAGTRVYVIHALRNGSPEGYVHLFYTYDGYNFGDENIWRNNANVIKNEQYDKGNFICYENYLKSSTNPTAGKYNKAYYELSE